MNVKELLMMAAKAAGYEIKWMERENSFIRLVNGDSAGVWNPLELDGDALRLAVKLDLHVLRFDTMTTVRQVGSNWACDERDDGDSYVATRRAIVRAAAEIGGKL